MLEKVLTRASVWALDHVSSDWVDYVVSNTMTDFNRWFNKFLWTYELKAVVEQVIDEAPGVKTFVMRPNQHWRGFTAGQFIELSLPVDGPAPAAPLKRCYSVFDAGQGRVGITVKRVAQGRVSGWMHEHLKVGSSVEFSQAQGRFVSQGQRKLLFVCAGSGITPCHSMVEALLQSPAGQRPDVQVIAQFRQAEDVIFKATLNRWAQAGVKVAVALSGEAVQTGKAGGSAGVLAGTVQVPRVDQTQLQQLCPDLAERDVFLCGPTGFMTSQLGHLQALGVDQARVHTERFKLPEDPAPGAVFETDGAEVFFEHVNKRIVLIAADQGKTLLQLANEHGLGLESGCCQGMCGTCRLSLHDGQVSGNVLGRAVYLCTAYPASRSVVLGA
jgi:ferredoxin-NADP reductase